MDRELAGCHLADQRLAKRFETLVRQLSARSGDHRPLACQDWANTKAAYRFFANGRVDEQVFLAGHLAATRERFAATSGPVLVLHDTTEFTSARENVAAVGLLPRSRLGRVKDGHGQHRTICGILLPSSLAVTPEGLPLGLRAVKLWTRSKFPGTNALKRKTCPTRVPMAEKESRRWLDNLRQSTALLGDAARGLHIGDRESGNCELFCTAEAENTKLLFRTCVDRWAGDGTTTVAVLMRQAPVRGTHRRGGRERAGHPAVAVLEFKYERLRVHPPIGKHQRYPWLPLTVLPAHERQVPIGRDRSDCKLIMTLPGRLRRDAVRLRGWYAMRWRSETFHKLPQSGCRAEHVRLRTAERWASLLAVLCLVAWRVFRPTTMNRVAPQASPTVAFTGPEIAVLNECAGNATSNELPGSLAEYLGKVARLGGYLARSKDPPPGRLVLMAGAVAPGRHRTWLYDGRPTCG